MAQSLYIVSRYKDLSDAFEDFQDGYHVSMKAALAAASRGDYIHSIYADVNEVIIGENTLGGIVL